MKKFLSILLALAVGFTFTFGSAMSAFAMKSTDSDYNSYVNSGAPQYDLAAVETAIYTQAKNNVDMLAAVKANFLTNYAANKITVNSIEMSKTAVEKVIDTVFNDIAATINGVATDKKVDAVNAAKENDFVFFTKAEKEAYETAINNEFLKYDTAAEIKSYIEAQAAAKGYDKTLLTAEYAVQKAEVEDLLAKVDVTKYSDVVPTDADQHSDYYIDSTDTDVYAALGSKAGYYSFKAQVEALLAAAREELNKSDVKDTMTAAEMASKVTAISDEKTWFATNYTTKVPSYIKTTQEQGWDTEDITRAQEKLTAALNTYLNNAKAAEYDTHSATVRSLERKIAAGSKLTAAEEKSLASAKKALASLDSEYGALADVYKAVIENDPAYDTVAKINTFLTANDWTAFPTNAAAKTLASKKADKIVELKADAATKKAMVGFNGAPVYNATEVDKALEKAIIDAYLAANETALGNVTLSVVANSDLVKGEMNRVLGTGTLELDKKIYTKIGTWEANATTANYDDEKLEAVKAAIDEAKAAIRAAKTVEDVDAAFIAAQPKLAAVLTKADRNTAQTKTNYIDAIAKYTKELRAALTSKGIVVENFAADYTTTNLIDNLVGTAANDTGLYAAYTVEEMAAIQAKALETINALKSNKELAAEVNAINAEITAVKVPVTAADRAALIALKAKVDDYDKYVKTLDSSRSATADGIRTAYLDTLLTNVADIDAKEIKDAAKAIMKDSKVTLDEKEAVAALNALVDAYAKNYGDTAKTSLLAADTNTNAVYDYDFTALEVAAVEDAIAKIDPSANPLDVEAIKAARTAYDALGEATISDTLYAKLLSLENLAEQVKMNDADAKAYVQDLSIAVRTAKVGKKVKVTVNADVQTLVDNGYTVTYKFYKSTKKGSGYKNTVNKTTNTYTNTNPVKGKNYYKVKLVVKNADGAVVATTPLTQCKYGVRTIK